MDRIPRGVVDDGRLGVVRDREGVLVALDLGTGAVRWRHGRGLRPCAIAVGSVVALRLDGTSQPAVVVLDAGDGHELWSAPLASLPNWARPALDDSPAFTVDCATDGTDVLVHWTATAGYEGGAAPSREILDEHARAAAGTVRVDLRARTVETLPDLADTTVRGAGEPPALPAPDFPELGADVVDHGQVGGLRVELATPETGAVVLRAVDMHTDEVVWEIVLDEQARRGPPPLRQ